MSSVYRRTSALNPIAPDPTDQAAYKFHKAANLTN